MFEKQTKQGFKAKDLLYRNIRIRTENNEPLHTEDEMDYDLQSEYNFLQMARKTVKKRFYLYKGKLHTKIWFIIHFIISIKNNQCLTNLFPPKTKQFTNYKHFAWVFDILNGKKLS